MKNLEIVLYSNKLGSIINLYKKVVQILYNYQQRWHNPPFYAFFECPQKFDSGLRH